VNWRPLAASCRPVTSGRRAGSGSSFGGVGGGFRDRGGDQGEQCTVLPSPMSVGQQRAHPASTQEPSQAGPAPDRAQGADEIPGTGNERSFCSGEGREAGRPASSASTPVTGRATGPVGRGTEDRSTRATVIEVLFAVQELPGLVGRRRSVSTESTRRRTRTSVAESDQGPRPRHGGSCSRTRQPPSKLTSSPGQGGL